MPWKNTGLRKRGTCASDKMQSDWAIVKELPELVTNAVVAVSKWECLYDVLCLSTPFFVLRLQNFANDLFIDIAIYEGQPFFCFSTHLAAPVTISTLLSFCFVLLVNLGVTVIFYSLVVSVWTIIRDALLVGLATLGVTYAVFRAGKYIYVRRKVSDNIKRYPWHGWKCW